MLLSAAEIDAAFAEHRRVPIRQIDDRLIELCDTGRNTRRVVVIAAVGQVRENRVAEEHRLLRHVADRRPQCVERQRLDRHIVHQDLSFLWIPEARHEIHQRTLAAARRADDADGRAGWHRERDVSQHPARCAAFEYWIVIAHIAELEGTSASGVRRQAGGDIRRHDTRVRLQHVVDASHTRGAALKQVDHPAQRDQRPGQHAEIESERDEVTDGDLVAQRRTTADAEHGHGTEAGEQLQAGRHQAVEFREPHVAAQILVVE